MKMLHSVAGPLGINDAADPFGLEHLLGDSPGSLGRGDYADICLPLDDALAETANQDEDTSITLDQLKQIVSAAAAENALKTVNAAMKQGNVNTVARKAAFLAQVAHESAGLTKLNESGSDTYFKNNYDPDTTAGKNVGNTIEGDGVLFKGRGMIQLTGRENYTRAWIYFGWTVTEDKTKKNKWYQHKDPVDPKDAADPDKSAQIAGWYWDVLRNVNPVADELATSKDEEATFKKVTKKINGGYNGLSDRIEYYKKAKKALGITWGTLFYTPPKPKAKSKQLPKVKHTRSKAKQIAKK